MELGYSFIHNLLIITRLIISKINKLLKLDGKIFVFVCIDLITISQQGLNHPHSQSQTTAPTQSGRPYLPAVDHHYHQPVLS